LQLAGEFELVLGARVELPRGTQRLLAFLAIARRPVRRDRIGGALWSDTTQARADGNLRSALWRLGRSGRLLVERRSDCLTIADDVVVDAWDLADIAEGVLEKPHNLPMSSLNRLAATSDLLPSWDEPWLVTERERFRQLRLHALERAASAFLEAHDFARAIKMGLAAVEAEPFRESPYRLVIEAHLHEGNANEAVRLYLIYRQLAADELGVDPSPQMEGLMEPVRAALKPGISAPTYRAELA
jgi:DNA-binding SARP family transcriptional activator